MNSAKRMSTFLSVLMIVLLSVTLLANLTKPFSIALHVLMALLWVGWSCYAIPGLTNLKGIAQWLTAVLVVLTWLGGGAYLSSRILSNYFLLRCDERVQVITRLLQPISEPKVLKRNHGEWDGFQYNSLPFVKHGTFTLSHPNQTISCTGNYVYGQPEGKIECWFNSGVKYMTAYITDCHRVGHWNVSNSDGTPRAEGDFLDDHPQNPWIYYSVERPDGYQAPFDETLIFGNLNEFPMLRNLLRLGENK